MINGNGDQAKRLRELAGPSLGAKQRMHSGGAIHPPAVDRPPVSGPQSDAIAGAPRVVLVSELASERGSIPLAIHLAHLAAQQLGRTLLVDLTPAASRLPNVLETQLRRHSDWLHSLEPLWVDSAHGRTLGLRGTSSAAASSRRASSVDVVAQVDGELPASTQLPRICEQLVRFIGDRQIRVGKAVGQNMPAGQASASDAAMLARAVESNGEFHAASRSAAAESQRMYNAVVMHSEAAGVPLDAPCWQSADVVICLHDADQQSHLHSVLSNRLANQPTAQRVMLIEKQYATRLFRWRSGDMLTRLAPDDNDERLGLQLHNVNRYRAVWPYAHPRLNRTLDAFARSLAAEGNLFARARLAGKAC